MTAKLSVNGEVHGESGGAGRDITLMIASPIILALLAALFVAAEIGCVVYWNPARPVRNRRGRSQRGLLA